MMMTRRRGIFGQGLAALLLTAAISGADLSAQSATLGIPSTGKTVKVGAGVYELALSESTGTVYIASVGSGGGTPTIFALDAETLDPKGEIDVSNAPAFGLGINDRTQTLYTSNTRDGSVSVIDLAVGEVVRTITTESDPNAHLREIVVDENENVVYVSSYGTEGAIWVIDGATNQLRTVLENVGTGTSGMALDAAGDRLFTTNIQSNDISVIDLESGEVERRFPSGGEGPINATFDAATNRLFVANQVSGTMTALDARTGELLRSVATGEGALGIRFDPASNRVYIANRRAGTVTVVDAETYEIVADLTTGTHPNTVVVDSRTSTAYVTNKARSGGRGAPPVSDPSGDTVSIIRP